MFVCGYILFHTRSLGGGSNYSNRRPPDEVQRSLLRIFMTPFSSSRASNYQTSAQKVDAPLINNPSFFEQPGAHTYASIFWWLVSYQALTSFSESRRMHFFRTVVLLHHPFAAEMIPLSQLQMKQKFCHINCSTIHNFWHSRCKKTFPTLFLFFHWSKLMYETVTWSVRCR